MVKKRVNEPWMTGAEYGRSLRGLSVNLLVRDVSAAVSFAQDVLTAEAVYSDPDFAVMKFGAQEWMLHADHTYDDNSFIQDAMAASKRGAGIELRLHNVDPDAAEQRARSLGYQILAPTADKGHGLREVYVLDPDGYCWVLDTPRQT